MKLPYKMEKKLNLVRSGHTFVLPYLISGNFLLILDLKVMQSIKILLQVREVLRNVLNMRREIQFLRVLR